MKVKKLTLLTAIIFISLLIAVLLSPEKKNRVFSLATYGTAFKKKDPYINVSTSSPASRKSPEKMKEQEREDADCASLKEQYDQVEKVKKNPQVSLRFSNIHKKIEGVVYRLRFFYKESSEGRDVPTYLVYKEDSNEDDYIIEKSPYKKGPEYLKVESSEGDILYTEEGLNHLLRPSKSEEVFLHFENGQLKSLQGADPFATIHRYVQCSF